MLTINARLEGSRIIIDGLNQLAAEMPKAVDRGLIRIAEGVFNKAFAWLSGAKVPTGAYPVPVVTGTLRRLLDWLKPGTTKTGASGTFTAGQHEVNIYDSARYADTIHEGKYSSAKYGPRRFLIDAWARFNLGNNAVKILDEEAAAAIKKSGMK